MEAVTEGSWESLPVSLSPGVLQALRELGFARMTPVQVRGRSPPAPGPRLSRGMGSRGTGAEAGPGEGGCGRCQQRLGQPVLVWGRAAPSPLGGVGGLGRSPDGAGRSSHWILQQPLASSHWLCLGNG